MIVSTKSLILGITIHHPLTLTIRLEAAKYPHWLRRLRQLRLRPLTRRREHTGQLPSPFQLHSHSPRQQITLYLQITSYNPSAHLHALGGWMTPSDPRSRIILHMNWAGQTLPILIHGLPASSNEDVKHEHLNRDARHWRFMPQPSIAEIAPISPLAQIHRGCYRTPTYLVHGTADDLIPWQQTQRTYEALVKMGVPAGLDIVKGKKHLFDLHEDEDERVKATVRIGYDFLQANV